MKQQRKFPTLESYCIQMRHGDYTSTQSIILTPSYHPTHQLASNIGPLRTFQTEKRAPPTLTHSQFPSLITNPSINSFHPDQTNLPCAKKSSNSTPFARTTEEPGASRAQTMSGVLTQALSAQCFKISVPNAMAASKWAPLKPPTTLKLIHQIARARRLKEREVSR